MKFFRQSRPKKMSIHLTPATISPTSSTTLTRRQLLGGLITTGVAISLPWSLSIAQNSVASSPTATSPEQATFMQLSAYLTENNQLSAELGTRILSAFSGLDNAFAQKLTALWQWIGNNAVTIATLNEKLKTQPDFATTANQIMQAWYLGIVTVGKNVKVVAYEDALNAQTVADVLRPPTYAYGAYGSWNQNPASLKLLEYF